MEINKSELRDLIRQLIKEELNQVTNENKEPSNVTIVTGLWDLGRDKLSEFTRSYDSYLNKFAELLKSPVNMVIYVSKKDEEFVWQHRSKKNTLVKIFEIEDFQTLYDYESKVEPIRNNSEWYSQAGWLENSPQAKLKYYNPVVMSKMFLLNNATIYNPFNTDYFYWIDAGIINTVHGGYFYHDLVFDNLPKYSEHIDSFLYLSYPYIPVNEVHGFESKRLEQLSKSEINYVCRGGFFGGHLSKIKHLNDRYYHTLNQTLSEGLMGTEESIFTILSHTEKQHVYRFEINDDGLIWPFFEALKDVDNLIENTKRSLTYNNVKNNLYILTFNSPTQFQSICESINKSDSNFLGKSRNILINNSTDESTFEEYDKLCEMYGFEEIHHENLGVCGGRQFAAEHFDKSNADFYMFFEDDMHLNNEEHISSLCRNGFTKYVSNLYESVIKIMLKENFDFLKFSFSEFYGDNGVQWAWYNVPQEVRTQFWPEYDQLPISGLDENAPRTKFNNVKFLENVAYITGEIYYSNWPQIVSRDGNKKMFLDEKWERPFEQTWMSHIFQLTKEDKINPAVLLASPVTHERFEFYEGTLRKES
jgi:hypothetical protein